jgi:hypothetical protein
MAVAIAEPGVAVLVSAKAAWESAQTKIVASLGPDTRVTLDQWLEQAQRQ